MWLKERMAGDVKKLQKIRTFKDDMRFVQAGNKTVPGDSVANSPTSPTSKPFLPPVLNTPKPSVTEPKESTDLTEQPKPLKSPTLTEVTSAPKPTPNKDVVVSTPQVDPKLTDKVLPSISELGTKSYAFDELETVDTDSIVTEGTVITDQKRGRFKLFPAMGEAISMWFSEGQQAIEKRAEKKRQAVPTVRSVEDRKDIVKKAAEKSALAPKDDYAKLAKKLPSNLKTNTKEPEPAVIITKQSELPAPSWGHFEDENKTKPALLEQVPEVTEPIPAQKAVAPVIPPKAATLAPKVITIEEEPKEVSVPKPESEPTLEPVVATKPTLAPQLPTAVKRPYRNIKAPKNVKWLFYTSATMVAIVAVVGGAGAVWWLLGNISTTNLTTPTTNINTPQPAFSSLINEAQNNVARLGNDRVGWYQAVQSNAGSGIQVLIPTQSDVSERQASASEILSVLKWQVHAGLARSIENITFATIDQKPIIVLEVTSFDTAFGSLLLSEENLSKNLSPLFGPVVTKSYKVGVGIVSAQFIDDVVANHDVRILKDETDRERLVYGFIDQNTVLITTDTESFTVLADRVR